MNGRLLPYFGKEIITAQCNHQIIPSRPKRITRLHAVWNLWQYAICPGVFFCTMLKNLLWPLLFGALHSGLHPIPPRAFLMFYQPGSIYLGLHPIPPRAFLMFYQPGSIYFLLALRFVFLPCWSFGCCTAHMPAAKLIRGRCIMAFLPFYCVMLRPARRSYMLEYTPSAQNSHSL